MTEIISDERFNQYLFTRPVHEIRALLVTMCKHDPYVRERTRDWVNTFLIRKHEARIQREAEAAAAAAAAAAASDYYGYSTNISVNPTIIAGNTNCSINGVTYSSSGYNSNNINGTFIIGNTRTTINNSVTVNGRTIPLSNGPWPPPPPQNMKRRAVEEGHAAPSPKRMAVGAERRQQPVPVRRQEPVPARRREPVPERAPEGRQAREPEPVIPDVPVKREFIPNVKIKREAIPEVKVKPEPKRESSIPEVKTEPVAPRQVRIKLIKTEPREPTPAAAPSPPRRKSVRIKTEPTVIPSSVSVCDMCEKRYREVANTDRSCRHHPGYLALDSRSDEWMDWYHEDGDLPDTDEGRRQYPRGFEWTCCRRDGTGEACTVTRHVPRAAGVEPRRRPNAMILSRDPVGELARVRAVDWR